jgi:uncharacterized protein (DUF362 family)
MKLSAFISNTLDIEKDLQRGLDFIDWKQYVEKGSTVFIKPNFTYPYYKEGITTTPTLLKDVLEILKDRAGRVIVGESNGGNHSFSADEAFKGHDMHRICRETGAELVNLSKIPARPIEETIQGKKVKLMLPNLLLDDIDSFISIPVLKVHAMTGVTLSIKNLWGCYPDTMRCLHHSNLDYKLTLITKLLKPKLVVIDGIYALDGHGPMYGIPKRKNLIITSNNPVIADSLGAAIMGFSLDKARHILIAEKEMLGSSKIGEATINDDWEKFKLNFSVNRTLVDNLSTLLFRSDALSKIVLDSPFTPLTYLAANILRNKDESIVAKEMRKYRNERN